MKLVDCYLTVRVMFSRCAKSINLVDLFLYEDCPGAGLGESDKSFLRYRWRRAMDWFMLALGYVLPLREIHKSGKSFPL